MGLSIRPFLVCVVLIFAVSEKPCSASFGDEIRMRKLWKNATCVFEYSLQYYFKSVVGRFAYLLDTTQDVEKIGSVIFEFQQEVGDAFKSFGQGVVPNIVPIVKKYSSELIEYTRNHASLPELFREFILGYDFKAFGDEFQRITNYCWEGNICAAGLKICQYA